MYSQLKKEYFWCGMYVDIAKFVRYCKTCVDAELPVAAIKTLAKKVALLLLYTSYYYNDIKTLEN